MKGPIVVGGIGGSGTRVIASIFNTFHVFIGEDLNPPLDNLTYTLLFKRPKWFQNHQKDTKLLRRGLQILEKSMINNKAYTVAELNYLFDATVYMIKYGHNNLRQGTGSWPFHRLKNIFFQRHNRLTDYAAWGWKEPNAHLLLENMNAYFPDFKYIHTTRHGLDMAFSNNQQQLYNWGEMFGVETPKRNEDIPTASFRYWVEVNRHILELKEKLGEEKVFFLNFDKLCADPNTEIQKLIDFLNIEVTHEQFIHACSIPVRPKTTGRYKKKDTSVFNKEDIDFLKSINFEIQ